MVNGHVTKAWVSPTLPGIRLTYLLASLFGSALPDGVGSLVTENVLSAAHVLRFE